MLLTVFLALVFCGAITLLLVSAIALFRPFILQAKQPVQY